MPLKWDYSPKQAVATAVISCTLIDLDVAETKIRSSVYTSSEKVLECSPGNGKSLSGAVLGPGHCLVRPASLSRANAGGRWQFLERCCTFLFFA